MSDPTAKVFAGLALACLLKRSDHLADASRLSTRAFASARVSIDGIGSGDAAILSILDLLMLTKVLGNHSGFGDRWDWVLRTMRERTRPWTRVVAHGHAGRGLAWIGRIPMAKQQFQEARDLASGFPAITAKGPGRFSYLHVTMQYAAEAGLWALAGTYYRDVEQAAAELIKLNVAEPHPDKIRELLDFFRAVIKARRFPGQ